MKYWKAIALAPAALIAIACSRDADRMPADSLPASTLSVASRRVTSSGGEVSIDTNVRRDTGAVIGSMAGGVLGGVMDAHADVRKIRRPPE